MAESITKLANKLGRQPTEEEIARTWIWKSQNFTLCCEAGWLHIVGQMVGSRFDDSESQDLIETLR